MQKFIKIFFVAIFLSTLIPAQEEKKVLVEVFTNSHCPVCPAAHNTLDSYDQNSENADKINYIFYHMVYPYSDDPLYQYNKSDSDGRNVYYNPSSSTPIAFFEGMKQQNNYSTWNSLLDAAVSGGSPFLITLTGTRSDNSIEINADVLQSGSVADNDLVIHFVLVENINYQGRNGIAYHKNVMRKMVTSPTGEALSINIGETKQVDKTIGISDGLIPGNLGVVVFIQSNAGKTVYQSAIINYNELNDDPTDVDTDISQPKQFQLHQNYPNPFNPSTTIGYSIPESENVVMKVYNVLGKEIKTLVNKIHEPGNYEVSFNADNLSGGIYFYKLEAGNFIQTRKMILLK